MSHEKSVDDDENWEDATYGFEDVLEIPGLFILLGVAITQFVALFVNGRRTGRPRLIVIGSFVLAAVLAFLGGSAASYLVYAF